MILIDREIEVAVQIDPGYNSYNEARKLREELSRKQSDLRGKLEKSDTTDKARSTLSEYLEYKNYLQLVHLKIPHPEYSRIMLCLCLCRILKTDIEFYRFNSQISEDQIFSLLLEMKIKKTNDIELQHPFWSLKLTADRSKSGDNLIIATDQGYVLVRNRTIATNILKNSDVDLPDVTDNSLFKVEVTDKLATLKKSGVLSPLN